MLRHADSCLAGIGTNSGRPHLLEDGQTRADSCALFLERSQPAPERGDLSNDLDLRRERLRIFNHHAHHGGSGTRTETAPLESGARRVPRNISLAKQVVICLPDIATRGGAAAKTCHTYDYVLRTG